MMPSSLQVRYNYDQWAKCMGPTSCVTSLLRANPLTDWLLFSQAGRNLLPQVSAQEILQFRKSPEERWNLIHLHPLNQLVWNITCRHSPRLWKNRISYLFLKWNTVKLSGLPKSDHVHNKFWSLLFPCHLYLLQKPAPCFRAITLRHLMRWKSPKQ